MKYFFLILICTGSLFFFGMKMCSRGPDAQDDDALIYSVLNQVENKILQRHKQYHLRTVATTIGNPSGCLKLLGLEFDLPQSLTKEQLRDLLVGSVNIFLSVVNHNEELKKSMVVYPFTPKQIEVAFFIHGPGKRYVYHPLFGLCSARAGRIKYVTYDEEQKESLGYKSVQEETFEEAVALLEKQKIAKESEKTVE